MSNLAKFFWAVLAGVIMIWVGGGTAADAAPVTGCPPGEFPQGPVGNEPCGPVDLCSGDGQTTNWAIYPCDNPIETVPSTTGPLTVCLDTFEEDDLSGCFEVTTTAPIAMMLPATGVSVPGAILIGLVLLIMGSAIVWMARQ